MSFTSLACVVALVGLGADGPSETPSTAESKSPATTPSTAESRSPETTPSTAEGPASTTLSRP